MTVVHSGQPEVENRRVLSVSELTSLIKDSLRTAFSSVWVAGEISNLSQPQSGHIYLTLKDGGAQLRGVVWRSAASRLQFQLEDGLEVLCHGEIDVYAPHGSYQLIVRQIEPRGEGALQMALKQLRARLAAEGLFDAEHKKSLPAFPRRIALVTSPTGAAIRDFLEVAGRRWRGAEILIVPTLVQGAEAAPQIVSALATIGRLREPPDVLVLTRGGGSLEDLWCFNEEIVVRAIFRCPIPVVSAVGHEIDVTLADLVADVRALTPSEAAERVVPSAEDAQAGLRHVAQRMAAALRGRIEHARSQLTALTERPVLRRPHERVHDLARQLDELELRTKRAVWTCLKQVRNQLSASAGHLESLSPLAVLGRGYSVTMRAQDHSIVQDSAHISLGEQLATQLARGRVISRVEQTDGTTRPGDRTPRGHPGGVEHIDKRQESRKKGTGGPS